MGCAPSKPKPSPSTTPPLKSSVKPSSRLVANRPSAPHKSYETELSASLVESGGNAVPFHGLLDNKHNLARTQNVINEKLFKRSVHSSDDSHQPTAPHPQLTSVAGVAMTMPYTIIVAKSDLEDNVLQIASKVFDTWNSIINGWNPSSEVSNLNKHSPAKYMPVSAGLLDIFSCVDTVHAITEGRFDPTTGVLTVVFENSIKENERPPFPAETQPFKHAIGWMKRIKRNNGTASRTNANTRIDLDGISKGFVVDKIIEALVRHGYSDCYVDWAGDIRAVGQHPSGRPWRSAVIYPPLLPRVFDHWQKGTLSEMLNVSDIGLYANFSFPSCDQGGAIATSGDYFSMQKYGYHHIAIGEHLTVMKANSKSVASVCVAADTCAMADAVATAAMTFSEVDRSQDFLQKLCDNFPDRIFGYCVMGRNQTKTQIHRDNFTPGIFSLSDDQETLTSESSTPESNSTSDLDAKKLDIERIQSAIIKNFCTIVFNGTSIEVDSLVSCSMQPKQIVTFLVPTSFVKEASLDTDSLQNKLEGVFLKSRNNLHNADSACTRVGMSFNHIFDLGSCVLVAANVNSINFGGTVSSEIIYGSKVIRRPVKFRTPRSKLPFLSPSDQAKELFRQVPYMVWVVATKSADQDEFALTATSVSVPKIGEGLICFNVVHSSAFFAGFGGVQSRIRAHALSKRQIGMAHNYTQRSRLDLDAISRLENESLITADGIVEFVENIQDHSVVLFRVKEIRSELETDPLGWLHSEFI